MTETTSLIAWATDASGHCFYLSPAWYAFTGANPDGPDALDWLGLVRDDERDVVGQAFAHASDRMVAFGMPYWLKREDGGYTRVWDVGLPKFDEHHQFHGFFGTVCPLDASASEPVLRHEAPKLTRREREVLRRVADGNTSETIAAMLGISSRTVEMHVSNAMLKLGAFNRVHAVSTALKQKAI